MRASESIGDFSVVVQLTIRQGYSSSNYNGRFRKALSTDGLETSGFKTGFQACPLYPVEIRTQHSENSADYKGQDTFSISTNLLAKGKL